MIKMTVKLTVLLFIGLALSEVHKLVYFIWPQSSVLEYDLFLSKTYHEKITVSWYVYELGAIFEKMIWATVLCKIAPLLSLKFFKVCVVFLIYSGSQLLFYIYNRNTSFASNYFLYVCMACISYVVIFDSRWKSKYKGVE
jgi:hypothetical protein